MFGRVPQNAHPSTSHSTQRTRVLSPGEVANIPAGQALHLEASLGTGDAHAGASHGAVAHADGRLLTMTHVWTVSAAGWRGLAGPDNFGQLHGSALVRGVWFLTAGIGSSRLRALGVSRADRREGHQRAGAGLRGLPRRQDDRTAARRLLPQGRGADRGTGTVGQRRRALRHRSGPAGPREQLRS